MLIFELVLEIFRHSAFVYKLLHLLRKLKTSGKYISKTRANITIIFRVIFVFYKDDYSHLIFFCENDFLNSYVEDTINSWHF